MSGPIFPPPAYPSQMTGMGFVDSEDDREEADTEPQPLCPPTFSMYAAPDPSAFGSLAHDQRASMGFVGSFRDSEDDRSRADIEPRSLPVPTLYAAPDPSPFGSLAHGTGVQVDPSFGSPVRT